MRNKGTHTKKLGAEHYLKTYRNFYNDGVFGADVELCHSNEYAETHFDGLHVYYNPNAIVPLDKDIFFPPEITHNFYDMASDSSVQNHPDRALVSRQVFEPSKANLRYIVKHWFPEHIGDL